MENYNKTNETRCSQCGNFVSQNAKFCNKCGNKLKTTGIEENKILIEEPSTIECNNCGSIVSLENKYCTECGALLEKRNYSFENSFSETNNSRKLYSVSAIGTGILLGGPLATAILIARNYKVLGNEKYSNITIMFGILATVIMVLISGLILSPQANVDKLLGYNLLYNLLIAIIYVITATSIFQSTQKPYVDAFFKEGGQRESGWKVFGSIIFSLLIYLTLSLIINSVKSPISLESDNGIKEYNKGIEYQENNHMALAEQQYKLAIKKNPNLAEAYLNLGLMYIEDGWLEGGEKMTLKSISLFKSSNKTIITGNTLEQSLSIAYNNLGVIEIQRAIEYEIDYNYLLSKSHWEKGMEYFYEAVNLDPTNSKAQSNIKRFSDAY